MNVSAEWVIAAIGAGGVISTVAISVFMVREADKTIGILRSRSHRARQMDDYLLLLLELVWRRTHPNESMPEPPEREDDTR